MAVVRPQVGWPRYARGDGGSGLGHRHRTHSQPKSNARVQSLKLYGLAGIGGGLPGEPAIVAKKELSGQLMAGSLLRRLGIPFVERYDVSGSLADAEALIALARQGRVWSFSRKAHSPAERACPDPI